LCDVYDFNPAETAFDGLKDLILDIDGGIDSLEKLEMQLVQKFDGTVTTVDVLSRDFIKTRLPGLCLGSYVRFWQNVLTTPFLLTTLRVVVHTREPVRTDLVARAIYLSPRVRGPWLKRGIREMPQHKHTEHPVTGHSTRIDVPRCIVKSIAWRVLRNSEPIVPDRCSLRVSHPKKYNAPMTEISERGAFFVDVVPDMYDQKLPPCTGMFEFPTRVYGEWELEIELDDWSEEEDVRVHLYTTCYNELVVSYGAVSMKYKSFYQAPEQADSKSPRQWFQTQGTSSTPRQPPGVKGEHFGALRNTPTSPTTQTRARPVF
jgi:hypothetical protein